jgi:hypothetical protein
VDHPHGRLSEDPRNQVRSFDVDPVTGTLRESGLTIKVPKPTCGMVRIELVESLRLIRAMSRLREIELHLDLMGEELI